MPLDDLPISRPDDDLLGRQFAVDALVHELRRPHEEGGFCVGIQGAWGAGKTSVLHLIRHQLEEHHRECVRVIEFSPWNTHGTEQLLTAFFESLSLAMKPLGQRRRRIDSLAKKYFAALAKSQTSSGGRFSTAITFLNDLKAGSVVERRTKLKQELLKDNVQFVVLIDDLDRVEPEEVFELFRLIRLVADLPNVVYVLAYDSDALGELISKRYGQDSRFLEKVVQLQWSLPILTEETRLGFLSTGLSEALTEMDAQTYVDENAWSDTLLGVVLPLAATPRDMKRLAMAARVALRQTQGQIDLGDLTALESIRLFLPQVFSAIVEKPELFTSPMMSKEGLSHEFDEILAIAGPHAGVVRRLIHFQFPLAETLIGGPTYGGGFNAEWLKNHRVAHRDVLTNYLSLQVQGGLLAKKWVTLLIDDLISGRDPAMTFERIDVSDIPNVLGRISEQIDSVGTRELKRLAEFIVTRISVTTRNATTFLGVSPWAALNYCLSEIFKVLLARGSEIDELGLMFSNADSLLTRTFCLSALENLGDGLEQKTLAEVTTYVATERASIAHSDLALLRSEADIALVLNFVGKDHSLESDVRSLLLDDVIAARFIVGHIAKGRSVSSGSRISREVDIIDVDSLSLKFNDRASLIERIDKLRARQPPFDEEIIRGLEFVKRRAIGSNSFLDDDLD